MDTVFYLDDYNLICSNIHETFLNGNIKLFKNNSEIEFDFSCEDNRILLTFTNEYSKGDVYKVFIDSDQYDVIPRFIFHTKRFDDEYCPDVNSLGSFYKKNNTIFRMWSPYTEGAYVVINEEPYRMTYLGKGIYEAIIKGDLEKAKYHYDVVRNGEHISFKDIFSYSNSYDSDDSFVIDTKKLKHKKIKCENKKDPIIYELSVRDFSSDNNAPFLNKGKFLSFLEEGLTVNNKPIGIDYLVSLGISHIQLMPINNFDLDGNDYSWGYNPLDFNTFYWGYVVGKDAYSPIDEFRKLVDFLHLKNIKVNLDVVYNHVYKIINSDFNKMFPYYFYRYKLDGTPSDGTYCGNELRTECKFLKNYFSLMINRLIDIYDIDGVRFDLAGIIDINTIKQINFEALLRKEDFMMYGEGWNMGDTLPIENRTIIDNSNEINFFKFFNGEYRDALKGTVFEKYTKGYLLSNKNNEELIKKGFAGNIINPNQTINYVECHDNYTFYDKVQFFGYDNDNLKNICKSGLAAIVLSVGTPFIHAGQEFMRTKKGSDNSYNLPDDINKIDWSMMTKNYDVVEYFIQLVNFRKKHPIFNGSLEMTFSYYYDLLIASIGNIDIFINPTEYSYIYDNWITYSDILMNNGEHLDNKHCFDISNYSIIVAEKK